MVRYYHLELLACPECRNPFLLVYSLKEIRSSVSKEAASKLKCRRWCYLYNMPASRVPLSSCIKTCMHREIEEGVIVCTYCGRWYPIVKTIPVMMDDKYRDKDRDEAFANNVRGKLPSWIKQYMKLPLPLYEDK